MPEDYEDYEDDTDMAEDTDHIGSWFLIALLIVGWLVWHWASDSKLRYVVQYGSSMDKVTVEEKPEDCDWDYAPIGRKGCHYEKNVIVIKRRTDTRTGRRVISYNEGKSWDSDDVDT